MRFKYISKVILLSYKIVRSVNVGTQVFLLLCRTFNQQYTDSSENNQNLRSKVSFIWERALTRGTPRLPEALEIEAGQSANYLSLAFSLSLSLSLSI